MTSMLKSDFAKKKKNCKEKYLQILHGIFYNKVFYYKEDLYLNFDDMVSCMRDL